MRKKQLYVVSHTHWDREWYEDFQEYRARLVRMMDDLIRILESDPEFPHFMFDGQTIVIRDYLEIRPGNKERLYALIRGGRISVGPWYVMPDSFLVSGESLIRNLEAGAEICEEIGAEPMPNGYIPDLFGHNSQMPQIFSGFGIDTALLFRGIADHPQDMFRWRGADGTETLTFKVDRERAYSNFFFAVRWPFQGRAFDRAEQKERMQKLLRWMEKSAAGDVYLLLDGVDHADADPRVPGVLRNLREDFPDCEIRHASLMEYIAAVKRENPRLETLSGSLYQIGRNGMNNLLLKNVLSSQLRVKQMNDRSERLLTRRAEPLDSFLAIARQAWALPESEHEMADKSDFFREGWRQLLQNHAHDSICGCSVTDVHLDNEHRLRQSISISRTMIKNMGEDLSACVCTKGKGADGAVILFNPGQREWDGAALCELLLPAENQDNFLFYDEEGNAVPVQILSRSVETVHRYPLRELIGFQPKLAARAALQVKIPAFGYTVLTFDNRKSDGLNFGDFMQENTFAPRRLPGTMRTGPRTFDTGKLAVELNADGSIDVLEKASGRQYRRLHTLEDSGDCGDGYNYIRPAEDEAILAGGAQVAVLSDGPLAAEIRITAELRIPQSARSRGGSAGTRGYLMQEVTSYLTLTKDSGRVEIRTVTDNQAVNHRLRALFPTDFDTNRYHTKTPFAMTGWEIEYTGWEEAKETETFVHPSQGITHIGDERGALALYTKGLYEVSVSRDKSRTLELTLFRSVTNEPAGQTGTGGQMKGPLEMEYCLEFDSALTPAQAYIRGEDWRSGLFSFCGDAGREGPLPASHSFLQLIGTGTAFSSLRQGKASDADGSRLSCFLLRVADVSGAGGSGEAVFSAGVRRAFYTDLKGAYLAEAEVSGGRVRYDLKPCKFATLAVLF